MIKVSKKEKLLLAIIFRQIDLTAYRTDFSRHEFVPFFKTKKDILNKLEKSLSKKKINNFFYGLSFKTNFNFIFKNKFYNSELNDIILIFEEFLNIINDKNLKKGHDINIANLVTKSRDYYPYVLYKKLTKREREYISQVEHIGQNMRVHNKYYSIEELQEILNF